MLPTEIRTGSDPLSEHRCKRLEGAQHPDRNAQFEHINETIRRQFEANEPVISVDTKKKELVGSYKNGGRELRANGDPEDVKVHDFVDPEQRKAAPYVTVQGWG